MLSFADQIRNDAVLLPDLQIFHLDSDQFGFRVSRGKNLRAPSRTRCPRSGKLGTAHGRGLNRRAAGVVWATRDFIAYVLA
jgi:hypothetical protein